MFGWFKKDPKPQLAPVILPPSKGYTLVLDIAVNIASKRVRSHDEAAALGRGLQVLQISGITGTTWEARIYDVWVAEVVCENGKYYRVTRRPLEGE
jgi:hypothetical protein